MKRKIFVFLTILMLLTAFFISTVSSNTYMDLKTNPNTNKSNLEDDVPTWEENTLWTYRIDDFDLIFDETEGRSYELHIRTSDFKLKVASDVGSFYQTEFESEIELEIDINMDLYVDDTDPIIISLSFSRATFDGNIQFDKSTLGIERFEGNIKGIMKINSTSPINLQFLSSIPLPVNINLILDFDEPIVLVDFPISTDKTWGIPQVNLTIDGEIQSILLRIINIINNIAKIFGIDLIPPDLAQFLPIIDISDLLTLFNITDSVEILEMPEIFQCSSQKSISVEAGIYNTYNISIIEDIANIYYAPDEGVIVKMTGNFNEILPFLQNVNIELIDVGVDKDYS